MRISYTMFNSQNPYTSKGVECANCLLACSAYVVWSACLHDNSAGVQQNSTYAL